MPRPHGAQASNWWGSTAPTSGLVATGEWVGVRFRATAAGRIAGFRAYLHTADSGTHIGVLVDFTTTNPLRAVLFFTTPPTADGWRNVWFRPWFRVTVGHDYVVFVLFTGGNWRRTVGALASAVTHGVITFVAGLVTTQLDPANSSGWTSSTNANGVDILFQAD